ncbi:MAG TPA: hypothetical protein VHL53_21325 [Acidimicrobiia bacterium]|nr:hypothetical protein [Acidimicrobiia bacterium]
MKISKKLAVIAASGLASITVAGGAWAYFTATGTGSGTATVGTSSPWNIHDVSTSGAPAGLTPGGWQQAVNYTITNDSNGVQNLNAVAVTVKADDEHPDSVSGAPGCLTSWFDVMTSFNGADFAPLGSFNGGASKTGKAVVSMNNGGGVNQDACQGAEIPVVISAS